MAHSISLEVPPISNPKVLRIFDTSLWDAALPVSGRTLDIIPPGFRTSVTFHVTAGFDKLFNASNLNIYPVTDPSLLANLPDGIYTIRLTSVQGGVSQWTEYNHLRQVSVLREYAQALCSLNLYPCDTLSSEEEERRETLSVIKSYLDAAKAKVEWCNAPSDGIDLQIYAKKLMDKFTLSNGCKTC